jgi:hypothetical protein
MIKCSNCKHKLKLSEYGNFPARFKPLCTKCLNMEYGKNKIDTLNKLPGKIRIEDLIDEQRGNNRYIYLTKDDLIIVSEGIATGSFFGKKTRHIPYDTITSVEVKKGLMIGNFEITAAGFGGGAHARMGVMETAFLENVIAFPKQDYERWQEIAKKVRTLIKEHKHKKVEHHKKQFIRKIPGFRSDTDWKKGLAILGYTFIVLFILAIPFTDFGDSGVEDTTSKLYAKYCNDKTIETYNETQCDAWQQDIFNAYIEKLTNQAHNYRSNSINKPAQELLTEFSSSTSVQQDELNLKYTGRFISGCGYIYTLSKKTFSDEFSANLKNTNSMESAMNWNVMPEYSVDFEESQENKLLTYSKDDTLCFLGELKKYIRPTGHLYIQNSIVITKEQANIYNKFIIVEDDDELFYNYIKFITPFYAIEDQTVLKNIANNLRETHSFDY